MKVENAKHRFLVPTGPGRSGSGKSSLSLAIFRLLEISSGDIIIDGFSLLYTPQDLIRSRIIAIPQEPSFRPGTIRSNMDPASSHPDSSIIATLEKVGLWSLISAHGDGLGFKNASSWLLQRPRTAICTCGCNSEKEW